MDYWKFISKDIKDTYTKNKSICIRCLKDVIENGFVKYIEKIISEFVCT